MKSEDTSKNRYLFLGSGMMATLTEMSLFGHCMEGTKIIRQATGNSYPSIFKNLWREGGIRSFYKGYYPWAMVQSTKGIPILYTQSFVKDFIINNQQFLNFNQNNIERTSGILGGMAGGVAQAFFITPTQRLKIEALTEQQKKNSKPKINSSKLVVNIWKEQGLFGFYRGLSPMIAKKGIDWGIRFYGVEIFKNNFPDFYETIPGKFGAGAFGGALSLLTVPFDVMIASLQKSQKESSFKKEFNNLRQLGIRHFYRGGVMRFIHTTYHTGILIGFGQIYKDVMESALYQIKDY